MSQRATKTETRTANLGPGASLDIPLELREPLPILVTGQLHWLHPLPEAPALELSVLSPGRSEPVVQVTASGSATLAYTPTAADLAPPGSWICRVTCLESLGAGARLSATYPVSASIAIRGSIITGDNGALTALVGDLNGDGAAELVELIGTERLFILVWALAGARPFSLGVTDTHTQSPAALRWFTGDIDGDGRAELIQIRNNVGRLAINVSGWSDEHMQSIWSANDMGSASSAVTWLMGDINGDGRAEIVQIWDDAGRVAMRVYGWSDAGMEMIWSGADLGAEIGAVAWLMADVNGDGSAEIIQQRSNGGRLATTIYGWSGGGLMLAWNNDDMGEGVGAMEWLVGDVNGDGRAEIVQLWHNDGRLAALVYGWSGADMKRISRSDDMGEGADAVGFCAGNFHLGAAAEIFHLRKNGDQLAAAVYRWSGSDLRRWWSNDDIGLPFFIPTSLFATDVDGDGRAEIVLKLANHGLWVLARTERD